MSKILSIFIYALAVLTPGCGPSAKEKQTVSELTKEMQTFCVGRHLIDLPKGFELMNGGILTFEPAGLFAKDSEHMDNIDVSVIADRVAPVQFNEAVRQRQAELKQATHEDTDVVERIIPLGENATVFRIREIKEHYKDELHLRLADAHFQIVLGSHKNTFLKAEQRLESFIKEMESAKAPAESQPGFCIGPVVVKGKYTLEDAGFSFRSKAHPDLMFNVDINTYSPADSTTLLQRTSGPASLLSMFHIGHTVLRKGTLSVAGMKAEEWLGWTKLGDGEDEHKEHSFTMETMRDTPSPSQPQLHLNMSTGQQDLQGRRHAASLTDKEAIGVWDAVVKSIRLRPGVL